MKMQDSFTVAKPPMGWNSWNTFYDQIDENLFLSVADVMADSGLADVGYEYLIIDDCWSHCTRDSAGRLKANPDRFPRGIKALADYIHSKGLKIGIYSCCGLHTCAAKYPGSFEREFSDAKQFAEWGIDYLKYDNCYHPATLSSAMLYRRMSMALRSSGRDILLAACQWGRDDVYSWIRSAGVHTFRSTVDIQDSWQSIEEIVLSQLDKQYCSGPGCFNDMDILVVGMHGGGMNPETSMGGCTDIEYQTHFVLWAMMNSPLIIGCDVRSMSDRTREILTNPDVISINQDLECRSCYRLNAFGSPDAFILVKQLSGAEWAVGFFNFGETTAHVELHFWDMGLSLQSGMCLQFYDCLNHEQMGYQREFYACWIEPHGCRLFRCRAHEI